MSLPTESVTLPGSGLTFINYYGDAVTDAFRGAILAAEHELQSHFTDTVTVGMKFDLADLGASFSGQNAFSSVRVSYDQLVAALRGHAATADDFIAVNGLPASDPSGGVGFSIPTSQARMLGLASQSNTYDDTVTLNSRIAFTFGQDAIGVLEHEITEGVWGRTASLGIESPRWASLDLFRFTASGVRDYTGGADGQPTFFGLDAAHVIGPAYHNSIDAAGHDDGFDLGDWDTTRGDAFGPGGITPGVMTATDLQVLDVLGWTSTGSGPGFRPAPDDLASSLTDATRPMGQLNATGSAAGTLEQAGDRDWFKVTLQTGVAYTFSLIGHIGGAGSLGDPFLRLHDATGAVLASNDDIVSGDQPDARITFTPDAGGTFYVEAGAFQDGYVGTYRLDVLHGNAAANAPTTGNDVLTGAAGGDTVMAQAGNDSLNGGAGANYLRGDEGSDVINGGAKFDDINGNTGNDTAHGGLGDDWVVGGKDQDVLFGDDGNDLVYGNLGDDTLDGGFGGDTVRGGQGNDVLTGGTGADYLSGDRGDDTESGGAGPDIFHSFGDAGLDRVLDFSGAAGDRVQLDPGSTYAASQVGSDTLISITGGGQLLLVGVDLALLPSGWIFVG